MTEHDTNADGETEQTENDRVQALEAAVETLAERVVELESGRAGRSSGSGPVSRRSVLGALGIAGLAGFGATTASAGPRGRVGTSNDPLDTLYVDTIEGATTSSELNVLVGGTRALSLTPENADGNNAAGNVVLGHRWNAAVVPTTAATVSGGGGSAGGNAVMSDFGAIGGGDGNEVRGTYGAVSGGKSNTAYYWSAIGGGESNRATGQYSAVTGGRNNEAVGNYATIAGGGPSDPNNPDTTKNVVYDDYGAVGGGGDNQAGSDDSDRTTAQFATVGGGERNEASAQHATVAGGRGNSVTADRGSIVGGFDNDVVGQRAHIGGGMHNRAGAYDAVVPGGQFCLAEGTRSMAAGLKAEAADDESFVWNDGGEYHNLFGTVDGLSSSNDVASTPSGVTGPNTFHVGATGGVRIVTGQDHVTYISGGSTGWATTSARSAKTNVETVDPESVLEGIADMPVHTWEYRDEDGDGAGERHIGPMAGDFHEVVDVGGSDHHINSINADGVAFAAIQGLAQRNEETGERIDEAAERVEATEERVDETDDRVADLEAENEALRSELQALRAEVEFIQNAVVAADGGESAGDCGGESE